MTRLLLFFSLCSFSFLFGLPGSKESTSSHIEPIGIHNRILAKVNGKAISAMDLMKRMDMLFHQLYPKHAKSAHNRFAFYRENWLDILKEMVDRELILADAKDKELPLSDGDVREEMEEIFGPSIIETIDHMGLSFEEAWQVTRTNIIVRRMLLYKVNSKASASVKPSDVQQAFEAFAIEHSSPDLWEYRVLTVRGPDSKQTAQHAQVALDIIQEKKFSLASLEENIRAALPKNSSTEVSFSKELKHSDQSISPEQKNILSSIAPGTFSKPVEQLSRTTQTPVYRIYYLISHEKAPPPLFSDLEEKIKNDLLETAIAKETGLYLQQLREYYGIEELSENTANAPNTASLPYYIN